MAFVNRKSREVQIKLVYYGPGRGGKTTTLEYIYSKFKDRIDKEMVTVKSHGDRTLFFDFMPLDVGQIRGFNVKIQMYTVPGQVKYNATRKLVLNGVDGIVFVADLLPDRRKHNIYSLNNLQQNLTQFKKDIFKIPLVFQYNKIDLAEKGMKLLPISVVEKDLNGRLKRPFFKTSAFTGENILPALKKIIIISADTVDKLLKSVN
jgi:small GTP-binding protein